MKSHRVIWAIAGLAAVAAALVLFVREAPLKARPTAGPEVIVRRLGSERQYQRMVDVMIESLTKDPQAHRVNTRVITEAVAALAELGKYETSETWYALGLRERSARRPAESVEAHRKSIALRPDWSWPYNAMGMALLDLHREDEAEDVFRKAIELDPNSSRPHNDLAILLRLTDRLEQAEEEAKVAISLGPDDVASHNNYGNLLVALGKLEQAEQAYLKAIALEPDHPAPYYNLACVASLQHRPDDMVTYLSLAVVLDKAFIEEAKKDDDFDAYRDLPDFHRLIYGEE